MNGFWMLPKGPSEEETQRMAGENAWRRAAIAHLIAERDEAKAELDTASQLIGQVRGMIALGNTSLEIANVIDAWMFRKEPYA